MSGVVAITGTREKLIVRVRPNSVQQRRWAKGLRWVRWQQRLRAYEASELGANGLQRIEALGFTVAIDPALGEVPLEELFEPTARLDVDGRTVLVTPGLSGFDDAKSRAGLAAMWHKPSRAFLMPLEDAHRPGIRYNDTVTAALASIEPYSPTVSKAAAYARELATAVQLDHDEVPDWVHRKLAGFTREPFPHQVPAALSAVFGHRFIADAPGVGKSTSALLAAHLAGAERIVIVAPPTVVTHWASEAAACGLDASATTIRAGRKEPTEFSRVTVVPDSLLAARPALLQRLQEHHPQVLIADEAHRMKTLTSKRSRALMALAMHSDVRMPLTGTPVESGPHELAALLAFTGHLLPLFGGATAFIEQFCRVDHFGKLHPRKRSLGQLREIMFDKVWVRRKKVDVLPFLPKRHIWPVELDVTLTDYRKQLSETVSKIAEQLEVMTDPNGDEVLTLDEARRALEERSGNYISDLRAAAAKTKMDWACEHLAENASTEDPIIVWVHHKIVAAELSERLEKAGVVHASYLGGLSTKRQDQIVQDFQAGKLPVLIAGITAAGVGLTLTRASRALFLESHWAPSLMSQAMDRCHRIGQERDVIAQVTVALGTIDERIQKVLLEKGEVSTKVQGDDQDDVAVLQGDTATPRELIAELIEFGVEKLQRDLAG